MKKQKEKGITLVALAVTIIILLILAGITIAGITGEKGLIKEAKTAKELTELAALEEQVDLAIIKAEQKHRNPTLNDVIEELKTNKVISSPDQVNGEGAIHTDAGYLIEGKLDDYIGKTSSGDGNTTGNNTSGGNTTGNNTGDGNTTGNNTSGGGTTPETPTLPSTEDTKPFLPTGATQVEGTDLSTGLVIKDSNDNEWVWIEVPKSIYSFSNVNYTDIETALKNYASDYSSGCADRMYLTSQFDFTNGTEYNNWKNSMLESVFANGGFYVGRYEMGTETARTSSSESLTTPYIKQDMIPYNYISCSKAQILAKQLSTGGKQASLMFGIQWDLVLKYIETKGGKTQDELKTNSITWGNYKDATFSLTRGKYLSGSTWNNTISYTKPASSVLLSTGATTRNSTLNIYDLAGNVLEWTLESYPTGGTQCPPCVYRGGCYEDTGTNKPVVRFGSPATNTSTFSVSNGTVYIGARPALW